MADNHKFNSGDIVYVKCFLPFEYELGKIVRYDIKLNMYVMIRFLDNLDPESFWSWCYVKEEDIEFASKILDIEYYEKCFNFDVRLNSTNFLELYTYEFELAKEVCEGRLTTTEWYAKVREYQCNKKQKK